MHTKQRLAKEDAKQSTAAAVLAKGKGKGVSTKLQIHFSMQITDYHSTEGPDYTHLLLSRVP